MKTSTAVVSGIAALALIGGGTAYALTSSEPAPAPTPTATIEGPAPSAEATPEPTTEATPSAEPMPTPTFSATEATYIEYRYENPDYFAPLAHLSDAEFLAGGYEVCAQAEAGTPYYEIVIYPEHDLISQTVLREASILFCPDVYEANVGPLS